MFRDGLLRGKRILITGGGTGLGKSIGRRYVELGARLVICGKHLAPMWKPIAATCATPPPLST